MLQNRSVVSRLGVVPILIFKPSPVVESQSKEVLQKERISTDYWTYEEYAPPFRGCRNVAECCGVSLVLSLDCCAIAVR
jgi:hypothetical protein